MRVPTWYSELNKGSAVDLFSTRVARVQRILISVEINTLVI